MGCQIIIASVFLSKGIFLVSIICTFSVVKWLQFIHSIAGRGNSKHTLVSCCKKKQQPGYKRLMLLVLLDLSNYLVKNLGQIGPVVHEKILKYRNIFLLYSLQTTCSCRVSIYSQHDFWNFDFTFNNVPVFNLSIIFLDFNVILVDTNNIHVNFTIFMLILTVIMLILTQ